ncbi:MAG: hypothetical protein ACK47B_14885 [Armatimonadota bacterium]
MPPSLRLLGALCGSALALVSVGARADDWSQYRKDSWRTGLSSDPIRAPLAEIWSHLLINPDTKIIGPKTPALMLSAVALWKGRAFFTVSRPGQYSLHCLDQRTGRTVWKQALNPTSDSYLAPSVTASGTVYVYSSRVRTSQVVVRDDEGIPRVVTQRTPQFGAAAYSAVTGHPVGFLPYDVQTDVEGSLLTRLGLTHTPRGEHLYHEPLQVSEGDPYVMLFGGDCPLLLGDQLLTFTLEGNCAHIFTRLVPPGRAQHLWIEHLRHDHPVPGHNLPQIRLPMASAGTDVVIGSNGPQPFLMMLDPSGEIGRYTRWHRDFLHTLGTPVVSNGMVYVGAGGIQASSAIFALDAHTGATRWTHAPSGSPRDKFAAKYISKDFENCRCRNVPPRVEIDYEMKPLETYPGLVVSGQHVYGVVNRGIVALDAGTGRQLWRFPLGLLHTVTSLAGSPDYLFASIAANTPDPHDAPGLLLALRREDGKPVWLEPGPEPGELALSNGMLFLTNGNGIHAYGPAERVYRVAVDSSNPAEYRRDPQPNDAESPAGEEPPAPEIALPPEAGGADVKGEQPAAAPATPPLADATVLRLRWGSGLEPMLAAVRERSKTAAGVPLLLSLDWLSPTREALSTGEARLRPELEERLVETAARLAAESRAAYFEIAPEINAYLMRAPGELERVRELLRNLAAAVREASPETRVVVSLNAEVLLGRYGRGVVHLFGKPVLVRPQDSAGAISLLEVADVAGLTTHPQSLFTTIGNLPNTYLMEVRALLPDKPLVVTRLGVHCDDAPITGERSQYRYLHRILQALYWLQPELIAYPDLDSSRGAADLALRKEGKARSGLALWQAVASWPRVKKLSLLGRGPAVVFPDDPEPEEEQPE